MVSAHAGVSTASFYEQFDSKEACLLAACRLASQRILPDMPSSNEPARGQRATLRRVLGDVLGAWQRDLDAGWLLFAGALAAGADARAERTLAIARFERSLEGLLEASPEPLDLPAGALTGALCALAFGALREPRKAPLSVLLDDLLAWTFSYALPEGASRSSAGGGMAVTRAPGDSRRPALDAYSPAAPCLPRGRHRLTPQQVARVHRTRIIHGVAQATLEKGYAELTVRDIVASAQIARGVFYEHFADKHDAFLAAQRGCNIELLRVCSRAYFASGSWPERVWGTLATLTALITANPALARLPLIESYAAGAAAIEATEDLCSVLPIFLFEGYAYAVQGDRLPASRADCVAGAVFELVRRDIGEGDLAALCGRLPQIAYLALAPFTGAPEAHRLVAELSARDPDPLAERTA